MQLVSVEDTVSAVWPSLQPICQSTESPFKKRLCSPGPVWRAPLSIFCPNVADMAATKLSLSHPDDFAGHHSFMYTFYFFFFLNQKCKDCIVKLSSEQSLFIHLLAEQTDWGAFNAHFVFSLELILLLELRFLVVFKIDKKKKNSHCVLSPLLFETVFFTVLNLICLLNFKNKIIAYTITIFFIIFIEI